MIESRYTIEYIETEKPQKKTFSFLKFFTISLFLAALGLFAYSAITGTAFDKLVDQPFSYLKDKVFAPAIVTDSQVTGKAENGTDVATIVENAQQKEAENNEKLMALEAIRKELKGTISDLKDKLQKLTAEKDQISKDYNELLKEKELLEQTSNNQLTDNKTLKENLKRIQAKLASVQKNNKSLSEKIAIQQVENDTLSSLLKSQKQTEEKKKNTAVAASKPESPVTKVAKEQTEPASITEKNSTGSTVSIAQATEKEINPKEETKKPEDKKRLVADNSKSEKTEDLKPSGETEDKTQAKQTQGAAISSDVDAIVKAMQGTKK